MDDSQGPSPARHGNAVCERLYATVDRSVPDLTVAEETMPLAVDRYREHVESDTPRDASTISEWRDTLTEDRRWPDLAYEDASMADWEPMEALSRVREMALAYRTEDHPLGGTAELRQATVDALAGWLDRRPESDNWWHNRIGVPGAMVDVLVLLDGELPAERRRQAIEVLGQTEVLGTGANRLWTAQRAFLHGCLTRDAEAAARALNFGVAEIACGGDGIQVDYGFHQHGPRLQQFHYGASFARNAVELAWLVRDTEAAVPTDRLDLLADLLLEGHRWMQRGGHVSPATLDRAVSRRGALDRTGFADVIGMLAGMVDRRSDALAAYASHTRSGAPSESAPVTGHRTYWESDFAVHHRPGFFASVKYVSTDTRHTESINEENLWGANLTAGALYVTRRGDEYDDAVPAWNWSRVPGTTTREDMYRAGRRPRFAGGVTDGTDGVSAFEFDDGAELSARKAWFFGGDAIACLGAGIDAGSDRGPVTTALAQRLLRGQVRTSGTGPSGDLEDGTHERRVRWLHHDGVGYLFSTPVEASLRIGSREGNWHDINHQYADEPVEKTLFGAWIDHGTTPTGATYDYTVTPGVRPGSMGDLAADPPVEVLANRREHQIVGFPDRDLVQASFYEPGRLDGGAISVDQPCLLQARTEGTNVGLTVATPLDVTESVTVGLGDVERTVDLAVCASGRKAGSHVVLEECSLPDLTTAAGAT